MKLKYTAKDTEKILSAFMNIHENGIQNADPEKLTTLLGYPMAALRSFMKSIDQLKPDEDYIRENYDGIIGLITMRMNLAVMNQPARNE